MQPKYSIAASKVNDSFLDKGGQSSRMAPTTAAPFLSHIGVSQIKAHSANVDDCEIEREIFFA
jgi:hypothetical protein